MGRWSSRERSAGAEAGLPAVAPAERREGAAGGRPAAVSASCTLREIWGSIQESGGISGASRSACTAESKNEHCIGHRSRFTATMRGRSLAQVDRFHIGLGASCIHLLASH